MQDCGSTRGHILPRTGGSLGRGFDDDDLSRDILPGTPARRAGAPIGLGRNVTPHDVPDHTGRAARP